jgi:hypothetical protein
MKMASGRKVLVGLFATGTLLVGTTLIAAPLQTNPGLPFQMLSDQHLQIQEKVDVIPEIEELLQFWVPETIEKVEFAVRLPKVEASVDPGACASAFPACGFDQIGPANDQNDQPVRMVVLVARDGSGVEGLSAENFEFDNPFHPVGGPGAVPCESCLLGFYEGGSGLYTMFLEPSADMNWQAGRYAGAVKVNLAVTAPYSGNARGTTLVTFEIPAALGPID